MHKGYICIVLHAHLPYVRHPEHDFALEENWLFEAITETYIPLLDIFQKLVDDRVDFRLTLSLSPPLVEMFNDLLLRERYKKHIERLIELSEKELYRTRGDIHFEPVVRMYRERFKKIKYLYENVFKKDLLTAFNALRDTGNVEFLASAATHAFLPALSVYPEAVKAQIRIGAEQYKNYFNTEPAGIWLPECGYIAGFDDYLKAEDIRFFFLESHGILNANPLPACDVYAPVICPSGVFAFGRDADSSRQVWSSVIGYPGDFDYRDFYRDIGFDLDLKHIRSFLDPYGIKTFTGLKYYRITGKTDKKRPYIRQKAMKKVKEHSNNFIHNRELQIERLSGKLKFSPVVTATYDAELFGHWWFEGPEWLDALLRKIVKNKKIRIVTPSEYLSMEGDRDNTFQMCQPSMSTWGEQGYCGVWLNRANDYIYPHLIKAIERMIYLCRRYPSAKGLTRKALNQALRELLLSQQSDWAFMMKTGNTAEYAKRRFEEHIKNFGLLYNSLISGKIHAAWLAAIEDRNRIFPKIDYRIYDAD